MCKVKMGKNRIIVDRTIPLAKEEPTFPISGESMHPKDTSYEESLRRESTIFLPENAKIAREQDGSLFSHHIACTGKGETSSIEGNKARAKME